MKIRYAGSTHVGMRRTNNEDSFFILGEQNLYVVADGMGGHASGEVASQMAVETVAQFFIDTSSDKESTWPYKEDRSLMYDENRLITGIKLANRRIYEVSQSDPRHHGMGTTIVTFYCGKQTAMMGHVGDSRGYLLRGDVLTQITEDHTLLNDYKKTHPMSREEIAHFPHKNVIVRALGMKNSVVVDLCRLEPKVGDIYLLCSDGLSGMISDDQLCETILANRSNLEKACEQLIACANTNGGDDNVTALLIGFFAD